MITNLGQGAFVFLPNKVFRLKRQSANCVRHSWPQLTHRLK